jgi:hypothetical protein
MRLASERASKRSQCDASSAWVTVPAPTAAFAMSNRCQPRRTLRVIADQRESRSHQSWELWEKWEPCDNVSLCPFPAALSVSPTTALRSTRRWSKVRLAALAAISGQLHRGIEAAAKVQGIGSQPNLVAAGSMFSVTINLGVDARPERAAVGWQAPYIDLTDGWPASADDHATG